MTWRIMDSRLLYIVVPIADEHAAQSIARRLIEGKLAICINLIKGVRSFYMWEGKMANAAEDLMLIKVFQCHADEVEKLVAEMHHYKIPAILRIEIEQVNSAFLTWAQGL
jgi:periplasmic divalent cation tolerance protein